MYMHICVTYVVSCIPVDPSYIPEMWGVMQPIYKVGCTPKVMRLSSNNQGKLNDWRWLSFKKQQRTWGSHHSKWREQITSNNWKKKCWILPNNNGRQLRFDPQHEQKMVATFIDLHMLFLQTPKHPKKSSPVYLKDLLPGIAIFHHLPIHGATALVLVAAAEDDVSEQGLVVHSACQRSARFLGTSW